MKKQNHFDMKNFVVIKPSVVENQIVTTLIIRIIEIANDNSMPSFSNRVVALISVSPTPAGIKEIPPSKIAEYVIRVVSINPKLTSKAKKTK